jgi:hypothetical protein
LKFLSGEAEGKVVEELVCVPIDLLVESLRVDVKKRGNLMIENDLRISKFVYFKVARSRDCCFCGRLLFGHGNLEVAFCDLKMRQSERKIQQAD